MNSGEKNPQRQRQLEPQLRGSTAPPAAFDFYPSPAVDDGEWDPENTEIDTLIGVNWPTTFINMQSMEKILPLVGQLMTNVVAYRGFAIHQREVSLAWEAKVKDLEEKLRVVQESSAHYQPAGRQQPLRFNTSFSSGLFPAEPTPPAMRGGTPSPPKPKLPSSITAPESYAMFQETPTYHQPPCYPARRTEPHGSHEDRSSLPAENQSGQQFGVTQPVNIVGSGDQGATSQAVEGQELSEAELRNQRDYATAALEVCFI
jgi:hypothetical protein